MVSAKSSSSTQILPLATGLKPYQAFFCSLYRPYQRLYCSSCSYCSLKTHWFIPCPNWTNELVPNRIQGIFLETASSTILPVLVLSEHVPWFLAFFVNRFLNHIQFPIRVSAIATDSAEKVNVLFGITENNIVPSVWSREFSQILCPYPPMFVFQVQYVQLHAPSSTAFHSGKNPLNLLNNGVQSM
jgi:hypothetical protein